MNQLMEMAHFFVQWPYWEHDSHLLNAVGFVLRLGDAGVSMFFVLSVSARAV